MPRCWRCGADDWWDRGGELLCRVCHPDLVTMRAEWDEARQHWPTGPLRWDGNLRRYVPLEYRKEVCP